MGPSGPWLPRYPRYGWGEYIHLNFQLSTSCSKIKCMILRMCKHSRYHPGTLCDPCGEHLGPLEFVKLVVSEKTGSNFEPIHHDNATMLTLCKKKTELPIAKNFKKPCKSTEPPNCRKPFEVRRCPVRVINSMRIRPNPSLL